jgi:hypothetical protein
MSVSKPLACIERSYESASFFIAVRYSIVDSCLLFNKRARLFFFFTLVERAEKEEGG